MMVMPFFSDTQVSNALFNEKLRHLLKEPLARTVKGVVARELLPILDLLRNALHVLRGDQLAGKPEVHVEHATLLIVGHRVRDSPGAAKGSSFIQELVAAPGHGLLKKCDVVLMYCVNEFGCAEPKEALQILQIGRAHV